MIDSLDYERDGAVLFAGAALSIPPGPDSIAARLTGAAVRAIPFDKTPATN